MYKNYFLFSIFPSLDVFLPSPDNLLVNLHESKAVSIVEFKNFIVSVRELAWLYFTIILNYVSVQLKSNIIKIGLFFDSNCTILVLKTTKNKQNNYCKLWCYLSLEIISYYKGRGDHFWDYD